MARTHPLVKAIREALAEHADPDKAPQMQAYMKTAQPFYGVQKPTRKEIWRTARKAHPVATEHEYADVVRALWRGKHREEQYMAMDVATDLKRFRTHAAWPLYVEILGEAENWDTVDWIAAVLIGEHFRDHRKAHEREVKAWRKSANMWFRRATLLVHLKHRRETDVALLAETIEMLAHEKEFFIRKAIGWTLREYGKTDAGWVRRFVKDHEAELSGLTKREALKNL